MHLLEHYTVFTDFNCFAHGSLKTVTVPKYFFYYYVFIYLVSGKA